MYMSFLWYSISSGNVNVYLFVCLLGLTGLIDAFMFLHFNSFYCFGVFKE